MKKMAQAFKDEGQGAPGQDRRPQLLGEDCKHAAFLPKISLQTSKSCWNTLQLQKMHLTTAYTKTGSLPQDVKIC